MSPIADPGKDGIDFKTDFIGAESGRADREGTDSGPASPLPIVAIVVVYGMAVDDSRTIARLRTLRQAGAPFPAHLLVVDNGGVAPRESEAITALSAHYQRPAANVGVAGAYEAGRQLAGERGVPCLLLLDHDTILPDGFFAELALRLPQFGSDPTLAALLPRVMVGEAPEQRQVSPLRGSSGNAALPEGPTAPGELVRAINSGMVLRRSFVDGLGGFDQRFWLDGLDHWLCFRMRDAGMRVWCLASRLDHDLSVARGDSYVSLDRYLNILRAEALLYRECLTVRERARYLASLLFRAAVYPLRWRTFSYSKPSLRQCFRLAGGLAE